MAEAGASLAQAKKDLEAAQNDVTRCMAELEAAQASAKPELSTRSLKVKIRQEYRWNYLGLHFNNGRLLIVSFFRSAFLGVRSRLYPVVGPHRAQSCRTCPCRAVMP